MLILVGIVGSGKSTLATSIVREFPNYKRINQDELGDRRACESMVRKHLAEGASVIIDRCNFDRQQRRTWVELAGRFAVGVACIVMQTSFETCHSRIMARQDHPTGVVGTFGANEILPKFKAMYQPPRHHGDEGMGAVVKLTEEEQGDGKWTRERLEALLKKVKDIGDGAITKRAEQRDAWGEDSSRADEGRGQGQARYRPYQGDRPAHVQTWQIRDPAQESGGCNPQRGAFAPPWRGGHRPQQPYGGYGQGFGPPGHSFQGQPAQSRPVQGTWTQRAACNTPPPPGSREDGGEEVVYQPR
ncbi:hypothetical protein YB2330_000592, partial [Saitoella coloradoensis]